MGQISRGADQALGWRIGSSDGGLVVVFDLIKWVARLVFRFFFGRPLRGDRYRKTDAEWGKPGTRKLYQNERTPRWWSWQPERTRAVIRTGCLIVGIAIAWGWWDGTPFTWSLTHDLFSVTGIIVTWVALYKLTGVCVAKFAQRGRRPVRDVVSPMKAALAPLLGIPPQDVKITMGQQEEGKSAWLHRP